MRRLSLWAMRAAKLAAALLLWGLLLAGCGQGAAAGGEAGQGRAPGELERALALAERLEECQLRASYLSRAAAGLAATDPGRAQAALARAAELAAGCDDEEWRFEAQRIKAAGRSWPRALRERALAAADRIMEATGRGWGLRAVAEGWLALDRAQARAAVQRAVEVCPRNVNDASRDRDLRAAACLLARLGERARALEVAGRIGEAGVQASALRDIAAAAAKEDGGGAGELFRRAAGVAASLPGPYQRTLSLCRVATAWAATDPVRARAVLGRAQEAACGLTAGWLKASGLAEVAAACASFDRPAAWRLARSIDQSQPEARFYAFKEIALATPEREQRRRLLEGALQEALNVGFGFERDKAVALLAQEMAHLDPRRALEMVRHIAGHSDLAQGQALAAVAVRLAGLDLAGAEEAARGVRNPFWRSAALRAVGEACLGRNEARAAGLLRAALAAAGESGQPEALAQVALALAEVDLRQALEAAWAIGPPRERAVALARLSARLSRQAGGSRSRAAFAGVAFDQAVAAAGRVGEDYSCERAEVLLEVGTVLAGADPAGAARVLALAVEHGAGRGERLQVAAR